MSREDSQFIEFMLIKILLVDILIIKTYACITLN